MPRGDEIWPSWAHLFDDVTHRYSARPALAEGEKTLTYAELGEVAAAIAAGLIRTGVEPGEPVAIWAPNSAAWVAVMMGIVEAGAVVLPLNTRFRGYEAADILRRSGARVIFLAEDFLGQSYGRMLSDAEREVGQLPLLARRIPLTGDFLGGPEVAALAGEKRPGDALEVRRRIEARRPDDPVDLLFTSGTGGRPKGVPNNSRRSLRLYWELATYMGLSADDRYLIVNPFFHSFGLKAGLLETIMTGACAIPMAVFDTVALMREVERQRVTCLPATPTVYFSLLNDPARGGFDLSTVRSAITGAASIPVELVRRAREELGIERFLTAYGLTEATAIVTSSRPDDSDELIATTVGRPMEGLDVRIVDPVSGEIMEPGRDGEIQVQGFSVMDGYLEAEDDVDAFADDHWLRTGDIGNVTADGYLRITDRLKDIFIVGGFNVSPAEIEGLLVTHPHVAEAAVIGVPDERLGEVGKAFVVPRPGKPAPTEEEIVAFCRERLANFKVPRHVSVEDALPRNASGKVLKYRLRERAAASPR